MGGELLLHLGLIDGKSETEQRRIARQECIYALLLCFFFLLFGTLLLRLFDVPLSMVRVVGGVILARVGFDLFNPPASTERLLAPDGAPKEIWNYPAQNKVFTFEDPAKQGNYKLIN